MKRIAFTAAAAALGATGAMAGGLDRSGQSIDLIFEDGTVATASFGYISPTISSTPEALAGDVGGAYTQLGFGYKTTYSSGLDVALIYDQPFGAEVSYPASGIAGLAGTEASLKSGAITAVANYDVGNGVSVHGGLRAQRMSGTVAVPAAAGYTLDAEPSTGYGYLIGAAYERPDIALRVALTYNSEVTHTFSAMEASLFGAGDTEFDVTLPQSVNLEFQSGIAADTLVFGSVRWVNWEGFDITPAAYPGGSLVEYSNDVFTYSLGVGRRFNDTFSGALTLGYEEAQGGLAPNLGPTDGNFSVSVGGTYTMGDTKITGGVRWVDIGDATSVAGIPFTDNSAIAVGMSVTRSF